MDIWTKIATIVFMALPIGAVAVLGWNVFRFLRPTPQMIQSRKNAVAFKAAVLAHLESMKLSAVDAEAVNAWAWATKSGWDIVSSYPDSFPQLFKQAIEP